MSIDDKILPVIPTFIDLYEMEDKFIKRGERILELEAQVEKYKSEIRESCEDMRSEYRTCDLAHELGEKNKELESQLDALKDAIRNHVEWAHTQIDCEDLLEAITGKES